MTMMSAAPVTVALARAEDLDQICTWLCERAIYEDAFMLAAAPDPAWVRNSVLLVKNNLGIEFQPVRLWSILDQDRALLGFAVDYGWDSAADTAREVDCALFSAGRRSPRLLMATFTAILDQLFSTQGVTEVWARVRVGPSRQRYDRLFRALGAEAVEEVWDTQPTTGQQMLRVYYRATPASFYASVRGQRTQAKTQC